MPVRGQAVKSGARSQLIDAVFDFAQPEYYKNTLTELGTEILNQIQQSVKAKFEGKLSVVLIGHSRIWIQTNLFYQQSFFSESYDTGKLKVSIDSEPSFHSLGRAIYL